MPPSRLRTAAELESLLAVTHVRGIRMFIELDDGSRVSVKVNPAMTSLCFGRDERHTPDLMGVPDTHLQAVTAALSTQYWGFLAVKPDNRFGRPMFTIKQLENRHDDSSEASSPEGEPG